MKFRCYCGFVLSNAPENSDEYRVYSDDEWIHDIIENETITHGWMIPDSKRTAWHCSECQRVYVFKYKKSLFSNKTDMKCEMVYIPDKKEVLKKYIGK